MSSMAKKVKKKLDDASRAEVAQALGVNPATVSDWFRGANYPRPHRIPALAKVIGVEPRPLALELMERASTFQSKRGAV